MPSLLQAIAAGLVIGFLGYNTITPSQTAPITSGEITDRALTWADACPDMLTFSEHPFYEGPNVLCYAI